MSGSATCRRSARTEGVIKERFDDAIRAERLLRNLARRLELDAPGVSKSILEGLDEILTVTRLGHPNCDGHWPQRT